MWVFATGKVRRVGFFISYNTNAVREKGWPKKVFAAE